MPSSSVHPSKDQDKIAEYYAREQSLPVDVLRRCLGHLSPRGLVAASIVCREWHQLAFSDVIWGSKYQEDFATSKTITASRRGSSRLGCPAVQLGSCTREQSSPQQAWYQQYKERAEVERRWQSGQGCYLKLRGHRDYVRCAQLQGNLLASCSGSYMQNDCSIRLWDVDSGDCVEHMTGHGSPIWCMHFEGRRIASCDDEGGVRLWDLDSHRVGVASTLAPHSLKCLNQDAEQLVVSGEGGLLGLWSLNQVQAAMEEAAAEHGATEAGEQNGKHPRPWQAVQLEEVGVRPRLGRPEGCAAAPPADLNCIQVDAGLCAAGEDGPAGRVHLWDTSAGELRYRHALAMPRGAGSISTLSFQHTTGMMVAGSARGHVRVWDLPSVSVARDLRGHAEDVLCHHQAGSLLATGAADCTVQLWDLRADSREAQRTLQLPSSPFCLQMDDKRLAVGCADGLVRLADLRAADGHLRVLGPSHGERVWALAMDETRLVSASLNARIIVRSFAAKQPNGSKPFSVFVEDHEQDIYYTGLPDLAFGEFASESSDADSDVADGDEDDASIADGEDYGADLGGSDEDSDDLQAEGGA